MVDNFVSIHDGQNYLSRTRPNRYVLELTPATAASGSLTLFGKVSRIIVDASRSTVSGGAGASHGRFDMTMDIEDSGNNELKYIEQISNLNFTGAGTDQTNHFQVSEGANVKAGGSGTSVTLQQLIHWLKTKERHGMAWWLVKPHLLFRFRRDRLQQEQSASLSFFRKITIYRITT